MNHLWQYLMNVYCNRSDMEGVTIEPGMTGKSRINCSFMALHYHLCM